MILGQSLKSVLRTPLKTILFILLIAAVTAFACLGFGMLSSGNRLIAEADDTYTTKAIIEYIDEGYPDAGNYSAAMIEELSNFDRSVFYDNKNVLSYETKYDVGGYIEGYRSKVNQNTYGKFGVIRFRYRHATEDPDYGQIVIQEVYYIGDNSYHEDTLLCIRNEASLGLQEDHVYIAHGKFAYKEYQSNDTFYVAAYTGASVADNRFFSRPIWDITDQLENDSYKQSERYSMLMNIVESYNVMNNYISVELTNDVKFATPFLLQQTSLMDDGVSRFFTEEEYETSAKVIILSNFILARIGKSVGDTVHLGLYDASAKDSFWPESDYNENDYYTIVGVFKETSLSLNNLAFIPMPEDVTGWLPENAISYTVANVVLKNGSAEEYLADIQPHLPEAMRVSIYDQGYSQAIAPLLSVRDTALLLSAVSAVSCLIVLILFAYIFVAKQKDTAGTMVALGAGKHRALAYLLLCVLIIATAASAAGAFVGYRLSENVTRLAYEKAEETSVVDNSFSAVYMLDDKVEFVPDFKPDLLPVIIVACSVVLAALALSLIVSASAVNRSAPKAPDPNGDELKRAAFSIGLAAKSIVRGGAKNIIVPLVSLVLIVFIGIFVKEIATSNDKIDDIYDNSTVYAYCTSYKGKRIDRLSIMDDEIENLIADEHVEQIYRSCNLYMKVSSFKKFGTNAWINMDVTSIYTPTEIEWLASDSFINPYVDYDKVVFTESIEHTPEFLFQDELRIQYLEGYSEESFKGEEKICALPSSFMEEHDLNLGDEVKGYAKIRIEDGYKDREISAKIVAAYEKASSKNNMYVPLSMAKEEYLICHQVVVFADGTCFEGVTNKPVDTPEEELARYESVEYYYNKYPYNSIVFKLKDLRTLNEFKESLREWGYSSVDGIGKARIWVVVEDTFLNKSITDLNRHITYMTILFTVVYLLAVVIGFVLSYLLTKNRRSELAMMRSMGTGRLRTFGIFFLEQFILSLLGGAIGIGILWLVYQEILKLQWLGFAGYFICYWIGVIISTMIMNRVDVIKLLSAKD